MTCFVWARKPSTSREILHTEHGYYICIMGEFELAAHKLKRVKD